MKKISFQKAKNKIIEYSEKNFPDFYKHEEFNAAITHWLHTPKIRPPLMPEKLFEELPELFS